MKKLVVVLGLILGMNFVAKAEQLDSQFRVWKSTFLDGASYTDKMLASATIIVHSVNIASPTVNQTGDSYLAMYQSTNVTPNLFAASFSTRIFMSLDQGMAIQSNSQNYDMKFTSITFFSKQGGAKVNILWDWYNKYGDPIQATVHAKD